LEVERLIRRHALFCKSSGRRGAWWSNCGHVCFTSLFFKWRSEEDGDRSLWSNLQLKC
jgi:hypothetical protein